MKFPLIASSLSTTLACLHLTGYFTHRPDNNFESLSIQVIDNGAVVCNSARGKQAHNKDNPP
jgi:hypothetical protein